GRLWEPVDLEQADACYRAALASDLAGPAAHRVRLRLARWEKRAARWDAACALWEAARDHDAFDREPWEEIAKFHEHRRRDLPAARAIVAQALEVADTAGAAPRVLDARSEEHTSELQSRFDLVCRLLLEKKKTDIAHHV